MEVGKKYEFENITPAKLLAFKILSLFGKSSGDYELDRKIKKNHMTVKAITQAIHEYMYEKFKESTDSDDNRETKHIKGGKRQTKSDEPNNFIS